MMAAPVGLRFSPTRRSMPFNQGSVQTAAQADNWDGCQFVKDGGSRVINGRSVSMVFRGGGNRCPATVCLQTVRGRKVHLALDTATSDIRAVEFTPSSDGDSPILPQLLDQITEGEEIGTVTAPYRQIASQSSAGQWTAPMTRADAIRRSLTGKPPRSSRSARTDERGKRTARPQLPETKPCAPPGTTAGHSGSAGPDTMPVAGSRPRCAAKKPSENASLPDTPTAKPPKSRYASHSSTASTHSGPPRSSAWADDNGERGSHASGVSCASTPVQIPVRKGMFAQRLLDRLIGACGYRRIKSRQGRIMGGR
jgi:hypothetical protein